MANGKYLVDMEALGERFKIDEGDLPLPVLRFTLDDKEITYVDLVHIANQLASALEDRGCRFETMVKH